MGLAVAVAVGIGLLAIGELIVLGRFLRHLDDDLAAALNDVARGGIPR